jgi:hypothetical protein
MCGRSGATPQPLVDEYGAQSIALLGALAEFSQSLRTAFLCLDFPAAGSVSPGALRKPFSAPKFWSRARWLAARKPTYMSNPQS